MSAVDPTPPAGVDRAPPSDSEVAAIIAQCMGDIQRAVTLAFRRGWVAGTKPAVQAGAPPAISNELVHELTGYWPDELSARDAAIVRERGQVRWERIRALLPAAQPVAQEAACPRCQGSGEQEYRTHHLGPDDYDVTGPCSECNGTGAAPKPSQGAKSGRAQAYTDFLKREFGSVGESQSQSAFNIGHVARAFDAGWEADPTTPRPPVSVEVSESLRQALNLAEMANNESAVVKVSDLSAVLGLAGGEGKPAAAPNDGKTRVVGESLLRPAVRMPPPTPEQILRGAEVLRQLKEPPTRGHEVHRCTRCGYLQGHASECPATGGTS